MAWTTPRDWTAITDGIVTAASLNTDVRDNSNFLSVHTHSGAAGMGAASMSALTLTNLVTLTFADQSANPDAAGEVQRNGNDLLWYGSAVVNMTASNAAAGTASLRSLSTTSTTAAAGNHTHVPASPNQLIVDASGTFNSDDEETLASGTIVVQNAASEAVALTATIEFPDGADTNRYTAKFKYSGPSAATIETQTDRLNGAGNLISMTASNAGIISPAGAGTYTIVVTTQRTTGTAVYNPRATIYAREVGA